MNYNLDLRLAYEPLRSIAFGSISGSYAAIGTATLTVGRIIKIQNLTDAQLTFSLDGVNDMDTLPANGFLLLDLKSDEFYCPIHTTFYVKQTSGAPTTGSAYVSYFYAAGR